MRSGLLDVNVLIALAWPNHLHHRQVRRWFTEEGSSGWATCPLTQAGFIRISSNPVIIEDATSPVTARELLGHLTSRPGHEFWPDDVDFTRADGIPAGLFQGHRQVTDSYLVMLAEAHGGYLVTLNRGIAGAVAGSRLEGLVRLLEV